MAKNFLNSLAFGMAFVLLGQNGFCAECLTVETSADGARIKAVPDKGSATGLLEIVEAKSGRCVRTLHAGLFGTEKSFSLGKNSRLPAGSYRVRYREDVGLVLDSTLALPKPEKWVNPTDLVLTDKAIYVYDQGVVKPWAEGGETIQLVQRFGSPGVSANNLQFMNPSAAVQTPDHLELWVVEDGLTNGEGPTGNARVRKFRITSAKSEEAPLEWRGGS